MHMHSFLLCWSCHPIGCCCNWAASSYRFHEHSLPCGRLLVILIDRRDRKRTVILLYSFSFYIKFVTIFVFLFFALFCPILYYVRFSIINLANFCHSLIHGLLIYCQQPQRSQKCIEILQTGSKHLYQFSICLHFPRCWSAIVNAFCRMFINHALWLFVPWRMSTEYFVMVVIGGPGGGG